jgi:hypothetical protein
MATLLHPASFSISTGRGRLSVVPSPPAAVRENFTRRLSSIVELSDRKNSARQKPLHSDFPLAKANGMDRAELLTFLA